MKLLKFVDKYLGIIATTCMVVSYIPQLWLTYTTQNVSGQSLSFWWLLVVGLSIVTYKAIKAYEASKSNETLTMLAFQIPNLLLAVLMLIGVILFR